MANETIENTTKLIAIDAKQAKTEGVIERGSLDAKEILKTGRYKIAGAITKKVRSKKAGTPVVPDTTPEQPEDPEAKAKRVNSMTGAALGEFITKEGLDVDLEGMNLKNQRLAVIDALGESDEGSEEDEDL